MAFFLRFKRQLQRTRPGLIPQLEEIAVRAIKEAGGKVTGKHSLIQAQFDGNSLGFWIDILLLIETLKQVMEEAAADLYGYSVVLGATLPGLPDSLCRRLSGQADGDGIFLDKTAAGILQPYISVEASRKHGVGDLVRVEGVKYFTPITRTGSLLWKSDIRLTSQGQQPAILVTDQALEGKRDKIYHRIAGYASSADFRPLFVRFGYGGLNALTDCVCRPADLQGIGASEGWEAAEEIAAGWNFLFRQRLNNAPSSFAVRTARHFFESTLDLYSNYARSMEKTPVVILENIHAAEQAAANIAIKVLEQRNDLLLVGTCNENINKADIERWRILFPRLTETSVEALQRDVLQLPPELWEIGYTCALLGQYFPPDLFSQLFEEMGKNSKMFSRALSLLHAFGVIDTLLDPRPWRPDFQRQAEFVLGDRKKPIRALVRGRLLAWVAQKKIDPCLRLLEILKRLNDSEEINDSLILRSIHHEFAVANWARLKNALDNGILEAVAGSQRAPILSYIVETSIALNSDNSNSIPPVFAKAPPDCPAFPLLKAQALINQSLYYLGLRDSKFAVELAKEATLLCQKNGGAQAGACLAQAYRLFALAGLLRQRIGETIDYLGFALENAVKSGDSQDIGMAAYYNASVLLLYGNLSRAKALAEKARGHFLKAGSPEWADRSRFLEGRVKFEIGSYQEAIECFENIREKPEGNNSHDKMRLLEAWVYRAKVCSQPSDQPKPQGGGFDANLFELEALFLVGDYSKVEELSGIYAARLPGEDFFCIERPDWRSGFAQCELLYYTWDDLKSRMLSAWLSLAQSHLARKEAVSAMQQILRGGQFSEIDPYDAFYHFAWCQVLEQSGADQVDISTAVNVAHKRLQSRAARIDDMEVRRQYLTQPYWNKALEQAARKYKLI